MSSEALGGGVMILVAAVLWVAYLMPTWSRRRQYLATERNAVRLQQTLRILAETAEVPQQVRVEANARTVSAQHKLLAQAEDDARAEVKAVADAAAAVRRAAAVAAAQVPVLDTLARARRRLRRSRAVCSLVLLLGLVAAVGGIVPLVTTGAWLVLGGGVLTVLAALGTLSRLARVARNARQLPVAVAGAPRIGVPFEPVHLESTPVVPATWTPQPLPRPMHLSRGSIAQTAMASVDAAAQMRRAASDEELARRASALDAAVSTITRVPVRGAGSTSAAPAASVPAAVPESTEPPSRFAAMGIVGETEPGMTDLDAVLRRRRAV